MKTYNTNFTAIDIGSSKITIMAAYVQNNGDARVGYQGIFQSAGFNGGIITDFKQTEHSIVNAVYNLEKSLDRNISTVSIAISGIGSKSLYIYQKLRLTSGRVTKQDMNLLLERALLRFNDDSLTVMHYFPIEYTLDSNNAINNPLGMFGDVLGCRYHLVLADSMQVANIVDCFAKCNIEVKDIAIGVYATSMAVLTEDEKALGSIVIDFGSSTTSFAVFFGGQLIYNGYIKLGGNCVTSDIAKILKISLPAAEKLKVMYGSALDANSSSESIINLADIDNSYALDDYDQITSSDLSMIIRARIEEMVELLKEEYAKAGIDHLISRRIILTGGGAQLRGLKEIVSNIFKKQVRVGTPLNIPGFASDHSEYSYSSAIGLIKDEMINQKKNGISQNPQSILNRLVAWIQD